MSSRPFIVESMADGFIDYPEKLSVPQDLLRSPQKWQMRAQLDINEAFAC